MFIGDRLVFLELQKTGGSHICRLLEQYVEGRVDGKHNRIQDVEAGQYIIGSIRNPWDWYVSLWAYGASGQGAIRARTAQGVDLHYYHRSLPFHMGKNWLSPGEFFISLAHDTIKPRRRWQDSYADPEDPKLFRAWLKLLFTERRRFDIGEGYGFSPVSAHAGLMTYRYFRQFTLGDRIFRDGSLGSASALAAFDNTCNITTGMIKMESLEEDFVRNVMKAGVSLSEQQQASILNKDSGKTNISRRKPVKFYYDEETIELVALHDRYLIEKYCYRPPG